MLLSESASTPFDLRFRLFGVDVRVSPWFWLLSAMLGWNLTRHPVLPGNGMAELGLWIVACFVSILLHEFGHIWMGQAFGSYGHILLHGWGGLAIGAGNVATRWQSILVSVAGPLIQLALWGALYGLLRAGLMTEVIAQTPALRLLLAFLLVINLYWPILNLLPVWPLDGGQITRQVALIASPRQGLLASLWLSLILSAALALNAFVGDKGNPFLPWPAPVGLWAGILFAMLAVGSWQGLQEERSHKSYYGDDLPWER